MTNNTSTSININSTPSAPLGNQSEVRAQQGPLHDNTDQPITAILTMVCGIELQGGQGGRFAGSLCQQVEMVKAEVAKDPDVASVVGDATDVSN